MQSPFHMMPVYTTYIHQQMSKPRFNVAAHVNRVLSTIRDIIAVIKHSQKIRPEL
jgi:hypothetical protein